jgi:hypothetical protein
MSVPLLAAEHRWACSACDFTDVTHETAAHSRMHACRGLFGMTVPMVPAGTRCKVELKPREDYVNGDIVTVDGNGRPWMNATVTRDDGEDVAVYAPCATARVEA